MRPINRGFSAYSSDVNQGYHLRQRPVCATKFPQTKTHFDCIGGDDMTISLPGSKKGGFSGILGRKGRDQGLKVTPKKPLDGADVAKLFNKEARAAVAKPVKPAKLNDGEKQDRDRISSLRGALYSND